jgi:hypothetical protein
MGRRGSGSRRHILLFFTSIQVRRWLFRNCCGAVPNYF